MDGVKCSVVVLDLASKKNKGGKNFQFAPRDRENSFSLGQIIPPRFGTVEDIGINKIVREKDRRIRKTQDMPKIRTPQV
jgi:hypothetical protein